MCGVFNVPYEKRGRYVMVLEDDNAELYRKVKALVDSLNKDRPGDHYHDAFNSLLDPEYAKRLAEIYSDRQHLYLRKKWLESDWNIPDPAETSTLSSLEQNPDFEDCTQCAHYNIAPEHYPCDRCSTLCRGKFTYWTPMYQEGDTQDCETCDLRICED